MEAAAQHREPSPVFPSGLILAAALEKEGVFCEFADPEHVVFMLSPSNTDEELERLEEALSKRTAWCGRPMTAPADEGENTGDARCHLLNVGYHFPQHSCANGDKTHNSPPDCCALKGKALREAMLSPAVRVPAGESLGRVLARPGVSCPPAVPILMPGELIDKNAIEAFEKYGIEEVSVLL